ncbi:exocyst complex component Sec10-domain-containing protein [Gymnopilus junonius]|uniref:Exocyst complex component Sec10-domain-containing protein n=1 Tax=Gymnopilus junonius TaxID=109634 RepID=A0A9P5NJN7_GYMJU|nr:exocyst complex component Sec10-domain-containing protein [Gymnopilus junonius]
MDKFATLEPVKLYASSFTRASKTASIIITNDARKSLQLRPTAPLVGRLPPDLHLLILSHLPVPDLPAYSRCSRAFAAFAKDEKVWEKKWDYLGVDKDPEVKKVVELLERRGSTKKVVAETAAAPATIAVDDEFGDFATATSSSSQPQADEMGDFNFIGGFQDFTAPPKSLSYTLTSTGPKKESSQTKYAHLHALLKPLTRILASPPHIILADLVTYLSQSQSQPHPPPSLHTQATLLRLLSLFLSPVIQPLRTWSTLSTSLRSAMDRFDSTLLAAFDVADGKGDEKGMREAAESSWEVWDRSGGGDWEMGKVWAEKREIFYQQESGRWRALDNFTEDGKLDFAPMDEFIEDILGAINEHGARAVRVFPPASQVLLLFAERLANEVVGEYITTLLTHARESQRNIPPLGAASFKEAWKMVDAIMEAAEQRQGRVRAEDVVYQMFEANMDEYLDEEVESVKRALEEIYTNRLPFPPLAPLQPHFITAPTTITSGTTSSSSPTQNPALLKRTVLASFTNILLMPVTIVPRTVVGVVGGIGGGLGVVGDALMTGGRGAVQGVRMLNPQRWVGGNGGGGEEGEGYSRDLGGGKGMLFEIGEEDEKDADEKEDEKGEEGEFNEKDDTSNTTPSSTDLAHRPSTSTSTSQTPQPQTPSTTQLDLLLSLDIALELIHADREALKRVETFVGYPGHYGHRVHDTIEEVFVLMLRALGEGHVEVGFAQATARMKNYKPAEHAEITSVAPLVEFFELVHIGDTIQSIMQVYFDKELAPHIDKTDFLNGVVREKKRFENALDDSVASGLNAGTEVLMNQVEHIILTLTQAREYYPPEDAPLELGPTRGCTEAIRCLDNHCKLLKGSTSKEVLEVFYQEVGLRLIGILQKHIKRQIISLSGGFQVIADLNAYNAFVSSLKIPAVTAEFSHLKMLGHVYIVEDAKDLAQIVKDVARYGGAYRPEDVYEFIQRRSDWKKIEKQ